MQHQDGTVRPRGAHRFDFFTSWIADPFNVASVVPSSRMLARRMATGIGADDVVIELGAGTGTLTTALLAAGVRDENLYLVEQNRRFAAILETRFPAVRTLCADAAQICSVMPDLVGTVDWVVSGLPILWFDRTKKTGILAAVFEMLRDGGCLQQFTYLGWPPIGPGLRRELGLSAVLVGLAPLNLPPAFVYRIDRPR